MILLNFEESKFTNEQKTAYNLLKEQEENGFGNILLELLSLRSLIEECFSKKYREVSRKIKESPVKLPERSVNHTALLYSIFEILEKSLEFPFNSDDAKRIIINNAENLNGLLKESSSINVFWQSFSYNFKKGNIIQYSDNGFSDNNSGSNKNVAHFRIKNEPGEYKLLQIKLPSYYPLYVKYCKENSIRFLDNNSIKLMLTSKSNEYFLPSHQAGRALAYTDKKFGSCYQFKVKVIEYGIEINDVEILI